MLPSGRLIVESATWPVGFVPFATTSGCQNDRHAFVVQMNRLLRSTLRSYSVWPFRSTNTVVLNCAFCAVRTSGADAADAAVATTRQAAAIAPTTAYTSVLFKAVTPSVIWIRK